MDNAQRYTTVPKSLSKLLEKIPTLGRPEKVNSSWLASIGMAGGNNQSMIRVLKGLGAIGTDGVPTSTWSAIRAKDKAKLGSAIRTMYSDLFSVYPDADKKDTEALTAFFRANTDLGEKAQRLSVQTFQTLSKFGEFGDDAEVGDLVEDDEEELTSKDESSKKSKKVKTSDAFGAPVALTVNLQLQLPASADGEVYEKLFSSMSKHLKGLISSQ